jgi:actin-like ATPase involved in cell morphogenesis
VFPVERDIKDIIQKCATQKHEDRPEKHESQVVCVPASAEPPPRNAIREDSRDIFGADESECGPEAGSK